MKTEMENILGFFAEEAQGKWDEVEVHPVYCNEKGECDVVEEGEENMWSVYLHQIDGGIRCVADLPNKELAHALGAFLDAASKNRVMIPDYSTTYNDAIATNDFFKRIREIEQQMADVAGDYDGDDEAPFSNVYANLHEHCDNSDIPAIRKEILSMPEWFSQLEEEPLERFKAFYIQLAKELNSINL